MKSFIVLYLLLASTAFANVWDVKNSWNDQYYDELQEWIKGDDFHTNLFIDKNSRYYGVKADCADVTYAIRVIFSFENNLPFKVINPSYRRGHKYKYFSDELDKFNHIRDPHQRVVAFINFLGDSLGTEMLNLNDSYPIALAKISPADFHAYKIKKITGFLRHSHNIKEVTETGNFVLIWSNQQRKLENRPMKQAEWSTLSHRPYQYRWGFRRMMFPDYYELPKQYYQDYSTEQFGYADIFDEKKFYRHVKSLLKTREEDPNKLLKRQLDNLCSQANERIQVVQSSEAYRLQTGNKCMDYKDYDTYSTPSRDGRFLDQFNKLKDDYNELQEMGYLSEVDADLEETVEAILKGKSADSDQCLVEYLKGEPKLTLGEIYQGLKSGDFSSHPNDNIHRRWGVNRGKKTMCKVWY